MPESITVGVITDAAGAHLDSYLGGLAACQGVENVGLADPSGATFEKVRSLLSARFNGLQTFRDDRVMLESIRPNLALVTLEAYRAPEAIQRALESGCHVLAEKPACLRAEDFEPLVRLADSKHLHLMLALANRVAPPIKKARDLVASGALGQLYGADFHTIADQTRLTLPEYQRSWFASKAQAGGGFLIWLGIHWLDLVQFISGDRIQQVCGFIRNVGGQPIEVEDAAVLALQFEKGMVGTMHSGYYLDHGYNNHCKIWGSHGWLRCDLTSDEPLQWHSSQSGAGVQTMKYIRERNLYAPFVQAAVDCARNLAPPPVTGSEGLQVLKVVFALYRSAGTRSVQMVA
jgi:predicted dehydrogenase